MLKIDKKIIVIVPVDKDINNYAVLWNELYVEKIVNELNDDNLYVQINIDTDPVKKVCFKNIMYKFSSYRFKFSNDFCLPFIFVTPKLIKVSMKFSCICFNSRSIKKNLMLHHEIYYKRNIVSWNINLKSLVIFGLLLIV